MYVRTIHSPKYQQTPRTTLKPPHFYSPPTHLSTQLSHPIPATSSSLFSQPVPHKPIHEILNHVLANPNPSQMKGKSLRITLYRHIYVFVCTVSCPVPSFFFSRKKKVDEIRTRTRNVTTNDCDLRGFVHRQG